MAVEIERKFLVTDEGWRAAADSGQRLCQGYLTDVISDSGLKASVRLRIGGEQAWLNIKSAELGTRRLEFEYPVPLADAQAMLDALRLGSAIDKTRYHVAHAGHTWEIDVFHGDNNGLVVAEIELASEDEDFARPPWLGEEVSDDPAYYNVALVHRPYKDW